MGWSTIRSGRNGSWASGVNSTFDARMRQGSRHRGEPQPQLTGFHGRRTGEVGKQIELAFLDGVLQGASCTVDALVERLGIDVVGSRPLAIW